MMLEKVLSSLRKVKNNDTPMTTSTILQNRENLTRTWVIFERLTLTEFKNVNIFRFDTFIKLSELLAQA